MKLKESLSRSRKLTFVRIIVSGCRHRAACFFSFFLERAGLPIGRQATGDGADLKGG